jgi:hypothetical protein
MGPMDLRDGVPGLNGSDPESYEEFWPYYLSQHLHPVTRWVHSVATTVAVATGLTALARRRFKLLALSPALAYGPAFASHFIWEGNRPVTLTGKVLWAARADFEMLFKVFSGRIEDEAAAIREAAGLQPGEVTLADQRQRLGLAA